MDSTVSFGADVIFSKDEREAGGKFFPEDPGLEGALGTEIGQGEWAIDEGLQAFDVNPLFTTPDGKPLETIPTVSGDEASQSPPAEYSNRPYIWKYQ